MGSAVAASWRLFQEVTDLPTGVQRGANAPQEEWPNEATYNSISRNALPGSSVPWGMSAWPKGKPSQQGGFCLWAFVAPDPGEQKGEMCVPPLAGPRNSPTQWLLRDYSFLPGPGSHEVIQKE